MKSTRCLLSDSLSVGLGNLRDVRRGTITVMTKVMSRLLSSPTTVVQCAVRPRTDRNGTVAVVMGILLPVLVGTVGLGFEVGNWYQVNRGMQNAADSAAIAAATNASSNYNVEALAVAAQYGFVNGANNVTVTATNAATCPAGGNTCYGVTITGVVPLYLSQVVGFKGTTTVNGVPQTSLSATAVAGQGSTPVPLCMLALDKTVGIVALQTNGAPKANMARCSIMSNASATCNGHNLGADNGLAAGTDNGCGVAEYSNVPVVADPYAHLASNIPTNTCGSYPQEHAKKNGTRLPASNLWTGTQALSGNAQVCGDLQLTGDVTINTPAAGAVLVIENGQLDTNGHTLTSSSGSGLTVVFTGTNAAGYTYAPTGGGTLNVAAPTSGVWSGVAIFQDPKLTTGVDISAAGNSPTWDITGLVYLPNSNVTFSGAVNKSSNGQSCVLVVNTILINGTGSILSTGGCAAAGLHMPSGTIPSGRGQLVL
jgi:Flp pilus assembly protein TadG